MIYRKIQIYYYSNFKNHKKISKLSHDELFKSKKLIAHAGGEIKNFKYSNSLEALNYNYQNGFKFFELDLRETSDKKIVAVHKWKHWKKDNDYKKNTIPSYKEFMKKKINKQFSPLDMKTINNWFSDHNDAILVTDKINDPKLLIENFKFPERLIMELFDERSIEDALSLKFTNILISSDVIDKKYNFDLNRIKYYKKNGVFGLAASRHTIFKHPNYFKYAKKNGLKVYAFHLNDKKKFSTEAEMLCYFSELISGVYAEKIPSEYELQKIRCLIN